MRGIENRKRGLSIVDINPKNRDILTANLQIKSVSGKDDRWGRVHTETCAFSLKDITKELILEED